MEVTAILIMMFMLSPMSIASQSNLHSLLCFFISCVIVLVHPENHTVLPYTNVSSSCVVKGGQSILKFEKPTNKVFHSSSDFNGLSDYDIFVSCNIDENDDTSYNTTWTVTLLASVKNNMTTFHCEVLVGGGMPYSSNTATITVEDGKYSNTIHNYT